MSCWIEKNEQRYARDDGTYYYVKTRIDLWETRDEPPFWKNDEDIYKTPDIFPLNSLPNLLPLSMIKNITFQVVQRENWDRFTCKIAARRRNDSFFKITFKNLFRHFLKHLDTFFSNPVLLNKLSADRKIA